MAGLDYFPLQLLVQRGAGCGDVGEPALLALPDGVAWKVSQGISGTIGASVGTAATCGRTESDLGSRGFRRRSVGGCRIGGGASARDGAQDFYIDYDGYGAGVGAEPVWRGERFLFSDGFWVCNSALFAGAASGDGGDCGDRILA